MLALSLLLGLVAHELARPRIGRWAVGVGAVAGLVLWYPLVAAVACLAGLTMYGRGRLAAGRSEKLDTVGDVSLLAELVQLGLAAGLTFPAALEAAATEVHPLLQAEVRQALRRTRVPGMAPATEGGNLDGLFAIAAQSGVTGAPLLPAVDAFVQELVQEERTRRQAAARRLPVRLLVPVALLILPGFVVLTVAPALLGAFERLSF